MTAIVFQLTDAGRAAFVNPSNTGTVARAVVSVGITATAFAPSAGLAAVPNEIKRLATISGAAVGDDTVHVTIRDETADVYSVRGFGLYLDNGVLLGSFGQADVIVEKSARALMLLSTDLRFVDSAVPAGAIQFGNADWMNPPATTDRPGVVELATPDEAVAGNDSARAVTPLGLASVAAILSQAIAGRATWGKTLAAYGIEDAYTRTAVDTALAAKANKGTTLAAYGINDAAPASHVGAGGKEHSAATSAAAGFMSAADKAKLDGISAGAQANAVTSVAGRTGAVTLSKGDVGLNAVDNTADAQKRVAYAVNAGAAGSAGAVSASGITGQAGMWTSQVRPGPYRLYRRDDDSGYSVQASWSQDRAAHWSLRGYDSSDAFHAPCYVAYAGYADSADRAAPRRSDGGAINFNWSGQSGQPPWVWGGSDGKEMYVYSPSNFSVAYASSSGWAASAGNADTLDGLHAESFMQAGNFLASLAGNGYQRLPSGLIIQWGTFSGLSSGNNVVYWPIAFPNLCLGGVVSYAYAFATNADGGIALSAAYTTSGTIRSAFNSATAFVIVLGR
ncbi:gp53-like domain-containing protein [Rubrivivax gelatinosus]|uniref:Putative tail fiber protein gp53-like C-terminal domain-containing protein n=1 Tax=Rubrivivax gelatinosus TaxID=28068 RepID=A0ABS1DNY8_RUBGE|nr:hypothetical protein [Rubrivivax gelatinosus]MBK1711299.1 hypothetical protein [Rubrivivax gelatinosus]